MHLQQNVSRDCSQAFNCLQPHLFDLVIEHVNQEIESNHCELLISNREFGESFHTGRSHRQALVLQAVDKSTARSKGNQINLRDQGENSGEAVKGRPALPVSAPWAHHLPTSARCSTPHC